MNAVENQLMVMTINGDYDFEEFLFSHRFSFQNCSLVNLLHDLTWDVACGSGALVHIVMKSDDAQSYIYRGSVVKVLDWRSKGQGFESHQEHKKNSFSKSKRLC